MIEEIQAADTIEELAHLLRQLRRREARGRGDSQLSYRELAARTGWAHGVIGDYFSGRTLAPTDRFDVLVNLLGATAQEVGALATARDRIEENRRKTRHHSGGQAVALQQLPAPVPGFVGRAAEMAQAERLTLQGLTDDHTQVILFCGTAGVGKTALALHLARRLAGRFPDGSLYVDLRGYGPVQPLAPQAALAGFLRSLGAAEPELVAEVGELSARFRSLIAGRRMIIMLDNASDAQQVRPLLPGDSAGLVLVTSRDQLAGLVARDGARRVPVEALAPAEAVELLGNLIGDRIAGDPAAAQALAARCARLPLALRVAAELAIRRAPQAIDELVAELDTAPRALDLLEAGGDAETAVRQIFSWSYRHLSPEAARSFKALGVFPAADFEPAALAALAGVTEQQARQHAGELAGQNMLTMRGGGRYAIHDLLRAYAAELVSYDDELSRQAVPRLLAHYLSACANAVTAVYPGERPPAGAQPHIDPAAALSWLDSELSTLVALSHHCLDSANFDVAAGFSETLWPYLDRRGHYPEAIAIHGNAVEATHGDPRRQAAALGELGQAHARQGRHHEALHHLRQALALSRAAGDQAREATTLNSIAIACSRMGHSEQAIDHLKLALAKQRLLGNHISEGKVLSNLGIEHAQLGRLQPALHYFEQAWQIAEKTGDHYGKGNAHNNSGLVCCWLGRYEEALAHHEQALICARETGDRCGEGRVLGNLGLCHIKVGDYPLAKEYLQAALVIHEQIGDRAGEADALCYLGELSQATGAYTVALAQHRQALALAQEIGYQHGQSPAHRGIAEALAAQGRLQEASHSLAAALESAQRTNDRRQQAHAAAAMARLYHQTGEPGPARRLWRQAAAVYTELGLPEQHAAQEQLRAFATADGHGTGR